MTIQKNTTSLRAAVYVRYSSENQRDGYSIEYQLDECKKYIKEQQYEFLKAYVDEAVSGKSTNNRNAFFDLLSDVKNGLYDVVIVYKYSRFARNLLEATLYRQQIEKAGAKLISAMERIDDSTPEGRMMRNIIMTMDEYYSDNLSTFVLSSMYTAAKSGKFLGGKYPYGFTVDENNKFIENKAEADIVRRIFDLRLAGMLPADIVRTLHADGLRSRTGKRFTRSFISKMLSNERYIGTYKYKVSGYDPIIIENAFDGLVSLDKWEAVQELIKSEKRAPYVKARVRQRVYPLVGKIYCGQCGEPFRGNGKRLKNPETDEYSGELVYYTCRGQHVHGICNIGSIRKDIIEDFVFGKIKELILNEKVVDEISQIVYQSIDKNGADLSDEIAKMKKEKAQIERKLENLLDLFLDGEISKEILNKKSDNLQTDLKDLNSRLKTMEFSAANEITIDRIKDFLLDMIDKLETADDSVKKAIASQFISEIIVHEKEVTVKLTVTPHFMPDKRFNGGALYSLSAIKKPSRKGARPAPLI